MHVRITTPRPGTRTYPQIDPLRHPHQHRYIKKLAKLLFYDKRRIEGDKTSADREYALALLLNHLAWPKRQFSDMEAIWHIERRSISECVAVIVVIVYLDGSSIFWMRVGSVDTSID